MNTEDVLLDLHNRMTRAMDGYQSLEGDSEYTALEKVRAQAKAEGVALCRQYVEQELTKVRKRERTW